MTTIWSLSSLWQRSFLLNLLLRSLWHFQFLVDIHLRSLPKEFRFKLQTIPVTIFTTSRAQPCAALHTLVTDGTDETHKIRLRDCIRPTCPTSRFYVPRSNRMPIVSSTSTTSSVSAGFVHLQKLYPSEHSDKPGSSASSSQSTDNNKEMKKVQGSHGDRKRHGNKGYVPHIMLTYLQFSVIFNFETAYQHLSHACAQVTRSSSILFSSFCFAENIFSLKHTLVPFFAPIYFPRGSAVSK